VKIRFWLEDETRIGLKTMVGRLLTAKGVKPQGVQQWEFKSFWLHGLVEPISGTSFLYEFCHLDVVCFEKFLELFAASYPDEIHIIQLDNSPVHQSLHLAIPDNIILLFQPPYCPEVNPIERFWEDLKKWFKWELFDELDDLRVRLGQSQLQRLLQYLLLDYRQF
jgi:transposase